MKIEIHPWRFCTVIALLGLLSHGTSRAADADGTSWYSLEGKSVPAGNAPDAQGLVRRFEAPVIGVTHSSQPQTHGTVLLFPGGAYSILDTLNEGSRTAAALNGFGYDVAMLEYHVGGGARSREAALEDALATWKLLKEKPDALRLKAGRGVVMGYSAGGHLAARLVAKLPAEQQPDDVVLVYPAYLEERAAGAAEANVRPPEKIKSRLVAMMAADDRANWLKGAHDYVDAWQSAGGYGLMLEFKTGGHGFGMKPNLTGDIGQWPKILNYFLENGPKPGVGPFNSVLPWFLPNVEGRMAAFAKSKSEDQGAVAFLGDSITAKWNLAGAFPELKIANRGISGDTTRGMLCRLTDNVLDLHPKAIIFMGGINDLYGQPKGTPQTISANVGAIVKQIREASANTPVLVCEILPSKGIPNEIVLASNAAIAKAIEGLPQAHLVKTHAAFLGADGKINESMFVDGTHPNPAGYAVWQSVLKAEMEKHGVGK